MSAPLRLGGFAAGLAVAFTVAFAIGATADPVRSPSDVDRHGMQEERESGALNLRAGGTYRVFADFEPVGLGRGLVLGADVSVAGQFEPAPLPAPATVVAVDGFEVTMYGVDSLVAGRETDGDRRGGPTVRFGTEFPTAGTYRRFLDFQVDDTVHTAELAVSAEEDS